MISLADAAQREVIHTALDENLVVEAAAGTGKTSELVQRIVCLLAEGRAQIDEIVAVTFTEKAAGELKLRLRVELEKARTATLSVLHRSRLEQALGHLEEAHVNTIHGFCADLLRERPVEARIDPTFAVLAEPEARRLFTQAFDLWLQQKLEKPPDGIRRSLRRSSKSDDGGPIARLRDAAWYLAGWRDFPGSWRREPFPRVDEIDCLTSQLHHFAENTHECTKKDDAFYRDVDAARRASDAIRHEERVRARDYDGLEARLIEILQVKEFVSPPHKGVDYKWRGSVGLRDIRQLHEALVDALQEFARKADADLAALLHTEFRECIDRYELLKEGAGQLDFLDLLLRARDVVRDHDDVRLGFQRRYRHILVDEFQDTDPLQAEILLLLSAEDPTVRDWREAAPAPGKLFIVGDPKQSIYRFRRADVGVYQDVKKLLLARGARLLRLSTSFRSVPSIQRCVNEAFGPVMQANEVTLQADYIDLVPSRNESDQPSIVVLPVPKPYGATKVTLSAIDESLPDAIGAFVHWLVDESGWTVAERNDGGRDTESQVRISPRHICLLFRRFENFGKDVTRRYVGALEARSIPHLLVGGKSFHLREEIETLRVALSAIEWPDDELSVFAALRGSLFAILDSELLEYRNRFGRLHPYRAPKEEVPEQFRSITGALGLIRSLHKSRNYVPVIETIAQLLTSTRAHAGFALRPSGEQVLANVLHVAEMARRYEAGGGISFRGFIEELCREAESGEAGEAPILEEGSEGVRIMTVHKAKGLEFPVVILADLSAPVSHTRASRYIDPERRLCALRIGRWAPLDLLEHDELEMSRDEAEGIRLAYVAATRARDLLVIPAVGDQPQERRWISVLNSAIYPAVEGRRSSAYAARCPAFGSDSVLVRPDGDGEGPYTVKPGVHSLGSAESSYPVVWWDPRALQLGVVPSFGIRQKELIVKNAEPEVVAKDIAAYRKWQQERSATLERGSRRTLRLHRVTEMAAKQKSENGGEVTVIYLSAEQNRPYGPRYGALVHAVLASVSLDAGPEHIEQRAQLEARILGATQDECASAIAVVANALAHPLMQRARRAFSGGRCRRESPVMMCGPDGSVVEGVVDLAFEESGVWTVVDFKTDRELSNGLEIYKRQVRLYADMVARATGRPVSAVLLRV